MPTVNSGPQLFFGQKTFAGVVGFLSKALFKSKMEFVVEGFTYRAFDRRDIGGRRPISLLSMYVAPIAADMATAAFDQSPATHAVWYEVDFSGEVGYRTGARHVHAVILVATTSGEEIGVRVRRKGDSNTSPGSYVFYLASASNDVAVLSKIPLNSDGIAEVQQVNTGSNNRRIRIYEPQWIGL